MAATAELPRPGVEVVQEFQSAAPTIVRPTLVPFVCGPAKEVVQVLNTDGTLNASAKQGSYNQLPLTIAQSAFPSPRGNIAQVNVDEASVQAYFQFGGSLLKLKHDPGESFLAAWNLGASASIQSKQDPGGGFILDTLTLVIALDVTSRLDTSKDVSITFAGATPGATLTAAQAAAQINAAVGSAVATATADNRIQITSLKAGAASSVTIRAGGSANTNFGMVSGANEYRVTGSGFRGQDQSNNTTLTPWVEWTRGQYLVNGAATTFPAITGTVPGFGLVNGGTFTGTQTADILYSGGSSILLQAGDLFYADGVQPVPGAIVKKVEAARFKLGVLNVAKSIFDANGNVVTPVYDDVNINTLFATVPFSPQFAWFKAENLVTSSTPTSAVATGTVEGTPATPAFVESNSAPTGPFSLAGLRLIVGVTIDGVVQNDFTFTFTGGPFADVPAVVAAIGANIPGVTAVNDSGKLKLATLHTGALQSIALRQTGSTAAALLNFVFSGDLTGTGADITFVAAGPVLLSGLQPSFSALPTTTLVLKISTDGGATYPTTRTHTFGAGPFANIAAVLADIAGDAPFIVGFTFSAVGTALKIQYNTLTGDQSAVKVDATSTGLGTNKLQFTSNQVAIGFDGLTGLNFQIRLNDRPKVYSVTFASNSLVDAVALINAAVGWPVASIGGGTTDELSIKSDLKGIASKVEVLEVTATHQANIAFGFAGGTVATGSGRPNPDLSFDISGNVVIGSDILRAPVTGLPFDPGACDLYIAYTGLRLDVSPIVTPKPSLISVSDVTTLTTLLGPLTTDNPLGLGLFFALINAPGTLVTGMGVSDAPAAAPTGTLAAYTQVASFIEAQEVYAIATLTHDETVAQMFKAHLELMESPEQKGERILFFNPSVPARANDAVMASGLNGSTNLTPNTFILDVNPGSALVAAGVNPALPIPVSAGLYLQIVVGGVVRKYSITAVNGVVLTANVVFTGSQNTDGFYTTTPLTEQLVAEAYSLEVRGAPLTLPGSTLPDKDAIAATVQGKGQAYGYRRMFYIFPDKVKASVNGVDTLLDAYYAASAIAGMCAHFPPQQGFTNMPMVGFTGVQGSQDTYSNRQLNVMAAGGVYILVQDATGAPIISRMQLSTDTTTIEKRELSITKIVDFTSKFLRAGLRNFIGTFNITQPFLDTVSTVIHGMLKFLEENGVLISGDLNNIIQSTDQPDTVLVDVLLDVPFPCNYIRLTLVI